MFPVGMGLQRTVLTCVMLATAAREAFIYRRRHGLSFVLERAIADDDDSNRMRFSLLLVMS